METHLFMALYGLLKSGWMIDIYLHVFLKYLNEEVSKTPSGFYLIQCFSMYSYEIKHK